MERPSLYSALVELVLLFLAVVFTIIEKMMIPVGVIAVATIGRYHSEVIDFVGDTVDMALDIAKAMLASFSTVDAHSSSSSLTTPSSIIQLLLLLCLVLVLAMLSARNKPLPTRQSLQDLLDETSRKFRETEGTLRDWQSYGENQLRLNKELQKQNERLQSEKEQIIAEKVSKDKEIADSAEKIEHLTIDLDQARMSIHNLEKSRFTARFSLKVATEKAERWEQACGVAEDKLSKLKQRINKSKSQRAADHVDTLPKALEPVQNDPDDRFRQQSTQICALQQALDQQAASFKIELDNRQAKLDQLGKRLTDFGSELGEVEASVETLEKSKATENTPAQQGPDTLASEKLLADKDADLQAARAKIVELETLQATTNNSLGQTEARAHSLETSLDTTNTSLQQTRAELQSSKESLAQKDSSLQDTQAEIMELKDQAEELRKQGTHHDLHQQIALLTRHVNDRQAKIQQAEQAVADKDTALRDSQEEVMNLKDQVEDLTAAHRQVRDRADKAAAKVQSQHHEILSLNQQLSDLAARHARQAAQMHASDNAMALDHPVVERLTKEIANHQEQIQRLQTALDGARTELSAAKSDADGMDVEDHHCDHSHCRRRELQQDSDLAKVQGDWMARGKKIAVLEKQARELNFQMQNLRASPTKSPQVSDTANPDTLATASRSEMNMQIAKLRTINADNLARADREVKKAKGLVEKLRVKDLECKELTEQLQREKVAASTRIEDAIRERIGGAKKAFEEMKMERDRCRANNSTLLTRAEKAEKALAECQMQREHPEEENEKLAEEAPAVQADESAANPRKRGRETEEGEESGASRPAKIGRSKSPEAS